MKIILGLVFALLGQSAFADINNVFTVSCNAQLIGTQGQTYINIVSPAKRAPEGPQVQVDLGNYILSAQASYSGGANEGVRMDMLLFKKDEGPIVGQVNFAGVSDFNEIQVSEKRTAYSINFVNIIYQEKSYSRIDYSCTIARVQ